MYDNIPDRLVPPDIGPQKIYANPRINPLAYNRETLNAAEELFGKAIANNEWDEKPALLSVDTDEIITYNELASLIDSFAGALKQLNIQPGDRVCCRFREVPEAVAAQFAIWRIGAVVVPCPVSARAKEISYYLADTEAEVILTTDQDLVEVETALSGQIDIEQGEVDIEEVVIHGESSPLGRSLDKLLAESGDVTEPYDTKPFDAASIFYTGGTTGKPKGCLHSHVAEVAITELECGEGRDLGPEDTLFCPAPIGHALGNGEIINFPFRYGADVVLIHRASPEKMVDVIEEQDVTIFVGSPTMLRMMLNAVDLKNRNLASLRMVIVGGEMFDKETFNRWKNQTGIEPCNTVGMTQLRHWFISSYRGGEKFAPGISIGKPYAGFEIKLVDIEDPEEELSGPGQVGRLAIRGPTNITYVNNIHPDMPEVMDEYSVGSWGLADDAYIQDDTGNLYFETRLDNMIVSGGRQISGPEVEDTIIRHEAVEEVAVVGSPDQTRGEIVKAFIKPKPDKNADESTISDIQDFVKKEIAPYKYPREIEFLDKLPTDNMGKIQRAELRKRELDED